MIKEKQGQIKIIVGIITLILVIGIAILVYLLTQPNLEDEISGVTGKSTIVSCAEKKIEFDISCEYVSSSSYDVSAKFKRTDNLGLEFQKLSALIFYGKQSKLEEISMNNIFIEQEYTLAISQFPEEFQLLGILNEGESCITEKVVCVEKFVEEIPELGNETTEETQEQQSPGSGDSDLDRIEQEIENSF